MAEHGRFARHRCCGFVRSAVWPFVCDLRLLDALEKNSRYAEHSARITANRIRAQESRQAEESDYTLDGLSLLHGPEGHDHGIDDARHLR
jgi:hypothetical protein